VKTFFLEKEAKTTEIPHSSFFRKKKQKTAAETPRNKQ